MMHKGGLVLCLWLSVAESTISDHVRWPIYEINIVQKNYRNKHAIVQKNMNHCKSAVFTFSTVVVQHFVVLSLLPTLLLPRVFHFGGFFELQPAFCAVVVVVYTRATQYATSHSSKVCILCAGCASALVHALRPQNVTEKELHPRCSINEEQKQRT